MVSWIDSNEVGAKIAAISLKFVNILKSINVKLARAEISMWPTFGTLVLYRKEFEACRLLMSV